MKNTNAKTSLGCALAMLTLLIVMSVIASGRTKLPDSCGTVKSLINACTDLSESKIMNNFENKILTPSFSSCVTAEDYLSACGISFGFMRDDSCKLRDIRLLGAEEVEEDDSLMGYLLTNADAARVYIAAEYTDKEGAERTAVTCFYVTSDPRTGKITSIFKADY